MDPQSNGNTSNTFSLPLRPANNTSSSINPVAPDLNDQPAYPDPSRTRDHPAPGAVPFSSESAGSHPPTSATAITPAPAINTSVGLSGSNSSATALVSTVDPPAATQSPEKRRKSSGSKDVSSQEGRRPSGASSRLCGKCGEALHGQFVRALDSTFHLECFTCNDCGKLVASKFFPFPDQPPHQYPLCETDYFRRLDLLCYACGGALRGSHITALDRKYHIDHFTCSVCPTIFGPQDSYYEHQGDIYCHYHFSTKFAQKCNGCQTAILKQFVEIFRNGQNQHWHPECYMIHKYWNVRLQRLTPSSEEPQSFTNSDSTGNVDEAERARVRAQEEQIEDKVLWIWRTLSSYEEKSAGCISDMLLHVSNGAYVDGVMTAKHFILHVELLFSAADDLDRLMTAKLGKGLSYSREAKLLCKKVVAFFGTLAKSQDGGMRRLGVTQELLSLVTGLAHYLKLLIRICLQGTLKLERETENSDGLQHFLDQMNSLESKLEQEHANRDSSLEISSLIHPSADTCAVCARPVEDRCVRLQSHIVHTSCLQCSTCQKDLNADHVHAHWNPTEEKIFCSDCAEESIRTDGGCVAVTRLQQYVHLLKVAHARLLATLRTSGALPHTSDDPNLEKYDSRPGGKASPALAPSMLNPDARSKSYSGASPIHPPQSTLPPQELLQQQHQEQREQQQQGAGTSYEQTLGDIRRLRSTRMDSHMSSNVKHARTSRLIGGPEADSARPGSATGIEGPESRRQEFKIITDPSTEQLQQLSFGKDDMMKLDDIPRMVAAEQAKDQRPNANKYARGNLFQQGPTPQLFEGHRRNTSGGLEHEKLGPEGHRPKRFLCELSALEYFIVRHVAVLYMEPLLEGHYNQEELLELIEMRKPTFWGKFGKAFGKYDKSKGGRKKGIFGVALEQLVEKDGVDSEEGIGPGTLRIPALVQDTCMAMRQMDMSMEGVFRKNGNIRRLKEMAEVIDTKGAEAVDLQSDTPVQIAALLKKFLRELPEPLLTYKLHRLFITSQKIQDEARRKRIVHLSLCLLPKTHRETMEVLFCFLNFAASFSVVDEESGNKMDTHNLATVIAPNILFPNSKTDEVMDSFLAIEAVHSILQSNAEFSEVPEDIQEILNDSSLFSGSADITTKEILKRFGDIGTRQMASQTVRTEPATYDSNYYGGGPQASTNTPSGSAEVSNRYDLADGPVHGVQNSRGNVGIAMIHRVGTDDSEPGSWPAHGTMGNTYPQGPHAHSSPMPPNGFYSTQMSGSRDSFGSNSSRGRYRQGSSLGQNAA